MWAWSHTQEAYNNVFNNLHALPHEKLCTILAEWEVYNLEQAEERKEEDAEENGEKYIDNFDWQKTYNKKYKEIQRLPNDIMADQIWDYASEHAACDNGGFHAYVCPYYCGCHMVSFD